MLGNGAGGFRRAAGSPMAVPGAPSSLQVADLNSDGRLDVAVANSDADSVTVLLGNGAGRFRPAADSPFSVPSPMELAAGDLNGDGGLDFAVAGPMASGCCSDAVHTCDLARPRSVRATGGRVLDPRVDHEAGG